jgi:hypothetical protein
MVQIEEPKAVVTSPAAEPAEALIEEVREETRRRRLRNSGIVLLIVTAAGGIALGVALSGNSAPPPRVTSVKIPSPASFPQVSAALSHIPTPLRQALLATMASRSFIVSSGGQKVWTIYQAPDRFTRPSLASAKSTCSPNEQASIEAVGGLPRPPTVVGSFAYQVCYTGSTPTVLKAPVGNPPGLSNSHAFGLTYAQRILFETTITQLQGSGSFQKTADGYTWGIARKTFKGYTSNFYPDNPGSVVIQNGRVVTLVWYLLLGRTPITANATYSHFNDAPPVIVPKAP